MLTDFDQLPPYINDFNPDGVDILTSQSSAANSNLSAKAEPFKPRGLVGVSQVMLNAAESHIDTSLPVPELDMMGMK
jgi:hypothetical protein